MQPPSGNLCPDLLTSLANVYCIAPATRLQILFICPTLANVFETATKPSRFPHFWQGAESLAHATQNNILTSKSGPRSPAFYTFHFQMCFAPQWRALFQHLNFQKCFEHSVLCLFWLRNVLRATMACTFSTRRFSEPTFRPSGSTNHR